MDLLEEASSLGIGLGDGRGPTRPTVDAARAYSSR